MFSFKTGKAVPDPQGQALSAQKPSCKQHQRLASYRF